ncbi:beta family protein [Niallia circulans]|uniref:beta family protein n=1 Tax=Niallia circulans TaxID=1397 RepID=UPI0035139234
MFNHDHYVPILKWKRGERTALEKLPSTSKENITPLLEIQPVPYDHSNEEFSKTLDEHLYDIGQQVKASWNETTPIFVDLDTLYQNGEFETETLQNGQHPIEFVIEQIELNGIPAIPVTGINRHDPFHDAIKTVVKKYKRGLCIRLEESDFSDIDILKSDIDRLLHFIEVDYESVDIILDYKQILPQQEQQHITNLTLTIVKFPYLMRWRTFTLASTAYPKNLNNLIPTNSNGALPRTEWKVYKNIRNLGLARIPTFSDYNISHPDFVNLDPRIINMAAGVKYTAGNYYYIFRGIGVKRNGFSQMVRICNNVINHSSYYGKQFSFGDEYIYNCAHQQCSTGNAERWVTVGVNHHLSVVSFDVSNLLVASTAGSPQI